MIAERLEAHKEFTMFKVPFRQVYCDTFIGWLKAILWCHVVIRVFPKVHDFGSDALASTGRTRP